MPRMGTKTTVLVVDDDLTTLKIIVALLERAGYEVTSRSRALGTSAEVLRNKPDFVLLDIDLPALSGKQIARVIATNGRGTSKIIFHSGSPESELVELTRTHRALGWIRKSSNHAHFLREFRRLVKSAEPSTLDAIGT